jgi:hypothetical protein
MSDADFRAGGLAGDIAAPKQMIPRLKDGPKRRSAGRNNVLGFRLRQLPPPSPAARKLSFADPGPFDLAGTLNDRQVKASAVYDLALLDWAKSLPRDDQGRVLVPLFGDLKRTCHDGQPDRCAWQ